MCGSPSVQSLFQLQEVFFLASSFPVKYVATLWFPLFLSWITSLLCTVRYQSLCCFGQWLGCECPYTSSKWSHSVRNSYEAPYACSLSVPLGTNSDPLPQTWGWWQWPTALRKTALLYKPGLGAGVAVASNLHSAPLLTWSLYPTSNLEWR